MARLFELFSIFFKIGAFTIGGGYAMVPIIQNEICNKKNWCSNEEFLDIIAIAQSLPGVLAVNTASILGYKLLGIPGVIFAVLGAVLPSFIIILVIAIFYAQFIKLKITALLFKGIEPAVVSLIAIAVITLGKKVGFSYFNLAIGILVLTLLILHTSPILIIILCGIIGVVSEYAKSKGYIGGKKHAKTDN